MSAQDRTRTRALAGAGTRAPRPPRDLDAAQRLAEEAAIVADVLDGNRDRFRLLVHRYQGALVATIRQLVGSAHDAEDLAQQTFLDAFDALGRFDATRRFSTWLFRIGVNNAKDWLKSHKRGETQLDAAVASDAAAFAGHVPGPRRAAEAAERLARVRDALDRLPVQFREVIVLRDVQGMSYEEIQEVLRYPITTLKIRVVRGRAALERLLREAGDDGDGEA
jgi:RNA polymerase sigma-70 factor (ECF subfamily)